MARASTTTLLTRGGHTYARTEAGLVRLPVSARTTRQRVAYLVKKGLVLGAYMLAKHSNALLVAMLQHMHPNGGWKNIAAAPRR